MEIDIENINRELIRITEKSHAMVAKKLGEPIQLISPLDNLVQVKDLERIVEEKERIIMEKDNILKEMDISLREKENALREKEMIIAEKDKIIEELKKKLEKNDIRGSNSN